ncbi:MAG: hypothetical protein E5V64_06610 [Mesorhizobium sp.]|uniref:GcrA family cell cycle regulator n=1 Tax=Mesorhizobium sp. TaxID=1871066 RepID=UPI0011F517BE|nr:GcrA family cell cycle regulator [Mesorhizobium sp.]TIV83831.1 MAG: hypothetical protein E5V64_06610 [Mesorhizobium sp.]
MAVWTYWTPEEDATLKRMAAEGHSASVVSKAIGRSRTSILSRAFRQNLQFKGQQPATRLRAGAKLERFTVAEDTIIRDMAAANKSGADIADELKRSKSSVVKRARLIGAKLNGKDGPKPRSERKLNSSNIAGKKESRSRDPGFKHVTPSLPAVVPLIVKLVDLTDSICRYPIGDPRDETFGFCGHRKELGHFAGPYCAAHSNLAYTPPELRRRAAA